MAHGSEGRNAASEPSSPMLPMLTYAQNFEDVMLRRCLQDVERGFYIDIGAFHPVVDSVTNWFYHAGWRGVNVEPNPAFYVKLCQRRPDDINLPVAIAGAAGVVRLRLLDGLSTIVDRVSERWRGEGRTADGHINVDAMRLDALLDIHAGSRTVDFLKIDVEGAEADILKGVSFAGTRPRILLIEATEPNSPRPASAAWEPSLIRCGYRFAYFDGLNRFFVREEDKERLAFFTAPPNVFDNFFFPSFDRRVDDRTPGRPAEVDVEAIASTAGHHHDPGDEAIGLSEAAAAAEPGARSPSEHEHLLASRDRLAVRCEMLLLERDRANRDAAAARRAAVAQRKEVDARLDAAKSWLDGRLAEIEAASVVPETDRADREGMAAQNAQLAARADIAEQTTVAMSVQLASMEEQRNAVATQRDHATGRADAAEKAIAATTARLEAVIAGRDADRQAAVDARDSAAREIVEARDTIAALTAQIAAEREERETLSTERQRLAAALEELKAELEAVRETRADLEIMLAKATRRADVTLQRLRAERDDADASRQRMTSDGELLMAERDRLTLETARLELKFESRGQKLLRLAQQVRAVAGLERQAREALALRTEEIAAFGDALRQSELRLAEESGRHEGEVADLRDALRQEKLTCRETAVTADAHALDVARLTNELADRDRTLARLRESMSWRITWPMRYVGRLMRE